MSDTEALFLLQSLWEIRETPPPPPPALLPRTDDESLLYRGKVNVLFGDSESGKTWLALQAALEEVRQGENVVFFDFEDHADAMLERLRSLGATNEDLKLFYYSRVEVPMNDVVMENLLPLLEELAPTLVVFDSFDEMLQLHGFDPYRPDDVRKAASMLFDPMTFLESRAGVIVIDHMTHSDKSRQGGSQAKLSRLDGASIKVHRQVPFARGETEPGRIELYIKKDRPGHVRKVSVKTGRGSDRLAASVIFETFGEDELRIIVNPPLTSTATGEKDWSLIIANFEEKVTIDGISRRELYKRFRDSGGKIGSDYGELAIRQALTENRWYETSDGLFRNESWEPEVSEPTEELDEL
jgi:hypothetical protein